MRALLLGLRLALARLLWRFAFVAVMTSASFVAVAGLLERRASPWRAADNTLIGAVFGVALPLLCYAAASRACAGGLLGRAVEALARFGSNRRASAAGLLAASCGAASLFGVIVAVIGVTVARGADDPALLGDALTSAWIGALGGACYAAAFGLGSLLGRDGRGRFVVLVADWLLGSASSFAALPFPRGHLRNLLGGEPVVGMAQWQASASLAALVVAYAAVALWRTPR